MTSKYVQGSLALKETEGAHGKEHQNQEISSLITLCAEPKQIRALLFKDIHTIESALSAALTRMETSGTTADKNNICFLQDKMAFKLKQVEHLDAFINGNYAEEPKFNNEPEMKILAHKLDLLKEEMTSEMNIVQAGLKSIEEKLTPT